MFNPYKLIFTFYIKECLKNIPITKDRRDNVIILFKLWVEEIFCEEFLLLEQNSNIITKEIVKKMINSEDLEELKNEKIIHRIFKESENEKISNFSFEDAYDFKTAKKIYFFLKKHFLKHKIDPFSYTNTTLTVEEKISFLHDII